MQHRRHGQVSHHIAFRSHYSTVSYVPFPPNYSQTRHVEVGVRSFRFPSSKTSINCHSLRVWYIPRSPSKWTLLLDRVRASIWHWLRTAIGWPGCKQDNCKVFSLVLSDVPHHVWLCLLIFCCTLSFLWHCWCSCSAESRVELPGLMSIALFDWECFSEGSSANSWSCGVICTGYEPMGCDFLGRTKNIALSTELYKGKT